MICYAELIQPAVCSFTCRCSPQLLLLPRARLPLQLPLLHLQQSPLRSPAQEAAPAHCCLLLPAAAPTPREIDLTPVYFNFDNFLLTADGEAQLQKIYRLMKDYPAVQGQVDRSCRCKGYC